PGAPVVEVPQPTPGPQTALEAALAPKGDALPPDRRVFTLALPSSRTRLNAVRGGGALNAALPVTNPVTVACQAARAADGGTLFLVSADVPIATLRVFPGPVSQFLAALPVGYHEVESRGFTGLSIFPLGVHVLDQNKAK